MCQLLGMNCNTPTDIVFSFEGFRRRGGLTDHHAGGFGIGVDSDDGQRKRYLGCLTPAKKSRPHKGAQKEHKPLPKIV